MSREEIEEMLNILIEMGADTYLKYKLMILSVAVSQGTRNFFKDIFTVADKHRPLLLEMKGGAV